MSFTVDVVSPRAFRCVYGLILKYTLACPSSFSCHLCIFNEFAFAPLNKIEPKFLAKPTNMTQVGFYSFSFLCIYIVLVWQLNVK